MPQLAFLDLKIYFAPNYLLALFLEHYGTSESKGSFDYEKVKGVGNLSIPGIPSHNDFFSTLRGKTVSPETYKVVKHAWIVNEMQTLFDLLKWYSLLDVQPFLEAVFVYLSQYKERGLDLFKTATVYQAFH